MLRRLIIWCVLVVAAAIAGVAGCALGLRGPLPPPTPDSLRQSDAHMKAAGFEVMPDPASPSQPAAFNTVTRVYVTGAGRKAPRVIVLHELPGLRDGDIHVAAELGKAIQGAGHLRSGHGGGDAGRGAAQGVNLHGALPTRLDLRARSLQQASRSNWPSKDQLSFFDVKEVDGGGHSTLVHDPRRPEVAKEQLATVVKALNARLGKSGT